MQQAKENNAEPLIQSLADGAFVFSKAGEDVKPMEKPSEKYGKTHGKTHGKPFV